VAAPTWTRNSRLNSATLARYQTLEARAARTTVVANGPRSGAIASAMRNTAANSALWVPETLLAYPVVVLDEAVRFVILRNMLGGEHLAV
jgi:hypothetical protein